MAARERVRVWFLIKADPKRISDVRVQLKKLDEEQGDAIAVIRIDEVEDKNGEYNLVAPIDLKNDDSGMSNFTKVTDRLKKSRYVISHNYLKVTGHDPEIPHLAEGYISPTEFANDDKHHGREQVYGIDYFTLLVTPGRQKHSPGFTPWG